MALVPASSRGGSLPSQWTADSHGGLLIAVDDAATVPLTLKAAAGQTADLLNLLTNVGGAYLGVDKDGNVNIGAAADLNDAAFNGGGFAGDAGDFQAEAGTKALGARTEAGTLKWLVNGVDGAQRIRTNAAPADADLSDGEAAIWFDKTDGAGNTKLMVKGKSNNGTVKTATILLA